MPYKNYEKEYSNLVTFNPNKNLRIHRWYPLVEGFSSDLVEKIIDEQVIRPKICLDPFGGIGTTALTCQTLGIKCISVESSPFFYDVSQAKLNAKSFSANNLSKLILNIKKSLEEKRGRVKHPELQSKTFFENPNLSKWIFNRKVSNGIFDILTEIEMQCIDNYESYKNLLKISLASILPDVSNVFRNGKCLSYKRNWKFRELSRKQVHSLFISHLSDVILKDLRDSTFEGIIDNSNGNLIKGDARVIVKKKQEKYDLVITSPPYLNSRDYTDIYRLELWMLGYINDFESEKKLRKNALTSHVQVQLGKVDTPNIKELSDILNHLENEEVKLWNKNIPNMIRGYFNEIQNLLIDIKEKLNKDAKVYINVSNSAYAGFIIEVDSIIAKIAEINGYICEEIRIARYIKTSSQQAKTIDKQKMRESVIVLKLKDVR